MCEFLVPRLVINNVCDIAFMCPKKYFKKYFNKISKAMQTLTHF